MKRTFTLLAGAAFLCFAQTTTAQNAPVIDGYVPCGTDQAREALMQANPAMRAEVEANRLAAEEQDRAAFQLGYPHSNESRHGGPPTYIIPVVFHIIHDYGTENISDAQVLDCMRILNEDYRHQNADTASIVPAFVNVADDTEIEFRLAQKDPQGNCTNGIDRRQSFETYIGDDGSKLNYWDRSKYINIWVVKDISSGAAGYSLGVSNFTPAAIDGVIVLSTYVGSIGTSNTSKMHTVTHEIGHHLNLDHTWGNTNSPGVSCGNDGVTDTPVTEGWTTCNLTNNDVCNNGVEENVQNFMDYSYCNRMFTSGQGTRMRNCLQSSTAQRSSLVTPATATATGILNPAPCEPIADFYPATTQYVCAGGSLTFYDNSYNGQPTAYSWSFPGGTPSTGTDSVMTVQYNTPGTYSVSLTSSNAQGSDNFSRTGYVVVMPTTAQYSNWQYYEGFENTTQVSADWDVYNPQSNGWQNSTWAANTGTQAMRFDNATSQTMYTDAFMSPTVDISMMSNPTLTFYVAYAQRATGDADRLRVLVSTDCGETWVQRYSKSGATLATSPVNSGTFVPGAGQWRMETITFTSAQIGATNLRLRFEFISDGGNDIYIDDINIQGATGIAPTDNSISQFSIYPNPAQDNTMIEFSLANRDNANVEIVDMTGRVVKSVFNGELNQGTHQFPVSTAEFTAGIYMVRITTGEGRFLTRKLVVE